MTSFSAGKSGSLASSICSRIIVGGILLGNEGAVIELKESSEMVTK